MRMWPEALSSTTGKVWADSALEDGINSPSSDADLKASLSALIENVDAKEAMARVGCRC